MTPKNNAILQIEEQKLKDFFFNTLSNPLSTILFLIDDDESNLTPENKTTIRNNCRQMQEAIHNTWKTLQGE